MKKYITIKEAIDNCEKKHALIPLEFLWTFPDNFGINLCAVKGFEVEMTDDNQYKCIRIDFIPADKNTEKGGKQ